MYKRILARSLIASMGLAMSTLSHAQLNLSQFGIGSGNSAAASSASSSALTQLLQNYVGASQQVLSGQSSLASAMGMASAAGRAQQAAGLLTGTPSASTLSQAGNTQQSLSQSLTQAFANGGASNTPVSKQAFTDGLVSLGKGVTQYSTLQSSLDGVGSMNLSSLLQAGMNPADMQSASYIAQSAPAQLQTLVMTLTQAVQFASSHGITVPSIATSALKGF